MTTTEQHRAMGQVNLIDECHAIEQRWPGWHVWHSDAGKPYATHDYHDDCGCGVTVTASHFARIEEAIAVYEHDLQMARLTRKVAVA